VTGPEERDAGLQPERTVLAWQRTALASTAMGAVLVRVVARVLSAEAAVVAGTLAALAAIAGGFVALERSRRLRSHGLASGAMSPFEARTIVGAMLVIAAVAFLVGTFADGGFVVR